MSGGASSSNSVVCWADFDNEDNDGKFNIFLGVHRRCPKHERSRMIEEMKKDPNYSYVVESKNELHLIKSNKLSTCVSLKFGLSAKQVSDLRATAAELRLQVINII
ncbi:hypothetical protein RND81_14G245400 [Saponaria officinalis]|uniref:Uncharacterized protein n=1 Tax=Saponaria officinalis TaxID=3572 RepID=A0AAW1GWJ3_SAPOF